MEMKYFILSGKAKERYLELEKEEWSQRQKAADTLMKDRDDIEHFRFSRAGFIASIKFKEGKQPKGVPFVRADKNLPKDEVRPHGKNKDARKWRELLKSLLITTNCQETYRKEFKLTDFVVGAPHSSGRGCVVHNSRVAHAGPEVVAEVPTNEKAIFEPSDGFKEIKLWEFEKMKEDHKNYDNKEGYVY